MYITRSNSTGTFGANPTTHQFPVRLREYCSCELSFHDFTINALALIEREMGKSLLASGGFALFLRYADSNNDYLLVAMLKLKAGAGINEETLDLEPTLNIDVSLLHEAARINLNQYAAAAQPYLTFIRGRSRKGDVTEYFRAALACENYTDAKFHTAQLMKAAGDFVNAREDIENEADRKKERSEMRARLYECFSQNKSEVVLQTLAAAIMPSDPEEFLTFVRDSTVNEHYQLPHQFQPDKKTFSQLKRIQGRIGKTISLSFSVDDVQQSRVVYDPSSNAILLYEPSAELIRGIEDNALSS